MSNKQNRTSKAQIERRINKAILHIDRTSDTREIYFSDKGLRLIANSDFCIIETNFHRHVFNSILPSGRNMTWVYVNLLLDYANEYDCIAQDENGRGYYSYTLLLDTLKKKDETKYNIAWFLDLYFYNIFQPLYSLGDTEAEAFLVYESYMHNVARNHVIFSEHKEDVTSKSFVEEVTKELKRYLEGVDDKVIFPKLTDEERSKRAMDAMKENETEEILSNNGKEEEQNE